ncbi:LEM domain-containing protein 1 isoform X2 [Sphaeramia orbicularis]|uniref:LEM domain-containing protein 1 isoform X2 n=1 Tax=Sphaeramia orbicularis TaxID=375764 RepID=UPI00117C58A8|nr:lamina-associated polypeptide 2, isoforms beta/gamma-like isoform X2 [Sphaeramia orbicularis]
MPVFAEDPSQLSKSRLKSDLIAHNVALPPAQSKKEIYVELHMKHIDQKNAADFSSDEEDPGQDVVEEGPEDAGILDPSVLTDDDLKAALLKHGVKAGPIVASTRALYEKKLRTLLQSDGHDTQNGAEEAVLYSDSEEEEENAEDKNEESDTEDTKQTVEQEDEAEQESSEEPVKDTFKDLFPDTEPTPTGIYATRRRPIKGAAGRPIQYVYPDTPVSPTTLERQEVERRLVPVYIQMFVFLIVACVLYFIYICVEDSSFSPLMALLDSLDQRLEDDEGLLLQDETQGTPVFSEGE